jgi:hypothetical protein
MQADGQAAGSLSNSEAQVDPKFKLMTYLKAHSRTGPAVPDELLCAAQLGLRSDMHCV